jgi:polysaccharide export outer membrane protein
MNPLTKLTSTALALGLLALCMAGDSQAQAQNGSYQINPGDVLSIAVWNEPELNRTVLIRPDGGLSFPLVGDISARGRSAAELQTLVAQQLSQYIPDPVVTVSVEQVQGNRVYVIGQVREPGSFIMNPRLDVMQALALAGGMTAFAQANDIRIIRRRGGQQEVLSFSFADIARGRDLQQNVLLESGDVIVVP